MSDVSQTNSSANSANNDVQVNKYYQEYVDKVHSQAAAIQSAYDSLKQEAKALGPQLDALQKYLKDGQSFMTGYYLGEQMNDFTRGMNSFVGYPLPTYSLPQPFDDNNRVDNINSLLQKVTALQNAAGSLDQISLCDNIEGQLAIDRLGSTTACGQIKDALQRVDKDRNDMGSVTFYIAGQPRRHLRNEDDQEGFNTDMKQICAYFLKLADE